MDKTEYHKYLASRGWAVLKRKIRERSQGKCERCHSGPYHETHHLTYERIGQETLEDLQAVCEACHKFLSGEGDDDPLNPKSYSSNSVTLTKIESLGAKLTRQIAEAESAHDERKVDRLLKRKAALIKVQAQYVYIGRSVAPPVDR